MPLLWCISMEMQGTLDTGKIIFSTFLKNIYWKGVMKCIAHMSYRFLVFMEKTTTFVIKFLGILYKDMQQHKLLLKI